MVNLNNSKPFIDLNRFATAHQVPTCTVRRKALYFKGRKFRASARKRSFISVLDKRSFISGL